MAAAAQHAVFGIDAADPAGSLLTCVKELFDNALDACAVHATGRIDVSVEPLDATGHSAGRLDAPHRHVERDSMTVADGGRQQAVAHE